MRFVRPALASIALAIVLAACSHLQTVSPPGVDLSGHWQLDPRHSDLPPPPPRPHSEAEEAHNAGNGAPPRFNGPSPLLPMVSAVEMTIAQDRESMGIDYPNQSYRDVKWGEQKRSLYVVTAGWDQQRLIIETKSQPMTVKETYTLSDAGNTLTLAIDLSSKRGGDRHITRVFTRMTDVSPKANAQ